MFIKKFSHLHKLSKHRRGSCFAVLGYPRSGTTMLSEVVAMVTDYYFDRDNIFPSSSRVVLHSHWDPARFLPERAVYIVRDPVDVALSVLDYGTVRGLDVASVDALRAPAICKLTWRKHVEAAHRAGHHIAPYGGLASARDEAVEGLAEHLRVPAPWVSDALALLHAKHANQPHLSDTAFKARKEAHDPAALAERRAALATQFADEIALYERIQTQV